MGTEGLWRRACVYTAGGAVAELWSQDLNRCLRADRTGTARRAEGQAIDAGCVLSGWPTDPGAAKTHGPPVASDPEALDDP